MGARLAKGRIGISDLVTYAEEAEFLQKVTKEAKGEDDAADACRYLVATKAREVVRRKLSGL